MHIQIGAGRNPSFFIDNREIRQSINGNYSYHRTCREIHAKAPKVGCPAKRRETGELELGEVSDAPFFCGSFGPGKSGRFPYIIQAGNQD
jgi:hypothetical protein